MLAVRILGVSLLILAVLMGCSNKDKQVVSPVVPPKFVVSPDTLLMTDAQLVDTILISTDAPGTLNWQISGAPAWLSVSPTSGAVTQAITTITVTADTSGLTVGTHSGRVELISTGGNGAVATLLDVKVHPRIAASVTQLDFPDTVSQIVFSVHNVGTGTLSWSLASGATWLSLTPPSGLLGTGDSAWILADVDRAGLGVGGYNAQVTSSSNSQAGELDLGVTLAVPAFINLSTTPDSLFFDFLTVSRTITVRNSGNVAMNWASAASDAFVQLAPPSGSISAGDSQQVVVSVDRTGLATGVLSASIVVSETSGQDDTLPLALRNYVEEKWLIGHNIVDAEFDTARNLIVAATSGPNYLLVIDPFGQSMDSVSLPATPTCVGLRPDGAYAAVGHDGFLTYVDLVGAAVVQTYPVSTEAIDIILPPNGWAYVMPIRDQWENIRCIELSTGNEVLHRGFTIRADSRMRLHPSGLYAYGANRGLSPSDFEKYDLRPDTLIYMYDSPYHGDFAFSGNVWISEDGTRLFAASGNTFRSSTVQSEDMTYTGALASATFLRWVDHSTEAGRIVSVSQVPSDFVRINGAAFLTDLGTIQLPPFFVPSGGEGGTLYASEGMFAYFDGPGLNYVFLVKAAPGSLLLNGWALVTMLVADGP